MIRQCRASVLRRMMRRVIHRDRHMCQLMESYQVLNLPLGHGFVCFARQMKKSKVGTWTSGYTDPSVDGAALTLPTLFILCRSSSET